MKTSGNRSESTEDKIKNAAHKIFLRKGYSAARTRDVAEEAGINLALLNYYFRSKKNLFDVVMREKIQNLMGSLLPVLNDTATSLDEKVERIVTSYIETLSGNPDLPSFILNEIRKNNFDFIPNVRFNQMILHSSFMKQLRERSEVNPVHFFLSLLGMTIFPFIAKPIFLKIELGNEQVFEKMMDERKTLIPHWIKSITT